MRESEVLVAGCDLGKATARFVVLRAKAGGEGATRFEVVSEEIVRHEGRALDAFREWYGRAGVVEVAALGATGLYAEELVSPVLAGLPEDVCLEAALRMEPAFEGPVNVVSVGARGYSVFVRGADGRATHFENEKCSSGTGETMVKLAARFGLTIEEADRAALAANAAIPISARCSVFAKSELTHFANQGRPADELLRGYFESVARYVAALFARGRVDGPVLLIGGGSRVRALVRAFEEIAGCKVVVPARAISFEALGAAMLAAEQVLAERLSPLPADSASLIRSRAARICELPAAKAFAARVSRLEAPPVPEGALARPVVLGLDLGSTGAKAVLTSVDSGDAVLDVYDRTQGNPVEAAGRLMRAILATATPDVRAIAVTGSGREAVATVLRAAYPDARLRIVVQNEIVAHATAAIRLDDAHGESLSVVEIGGQDAKFIQIAGGQIVESDLNKACSAGTGSFLEEQATLYGVADIDAFTRLAMDGERPPDLGQMCTVFVAEAAAEAEGFSRADIFAGFQYSVIHNYKNRVMGERQFGRRIFFQGKPASGPSLAWTLAAVAGREVVVPPNPGAMGAWGIGLVALAELGAPTLATAPAFDVRAFLDARLVARGELRCSDAKCATLCTIDRATVDVRGTQATVFSGGACPKFEVSSLGNPKLPIEAPSAFDEREALLAPYIREDAGVRVVSVPVAGVMAGFVPYFATLLRELGFGARMIRSDARALARGEERCGSYDACAPVKIAHGLSDARGADGAARGRNLLFIPKVLDIPDRDGPGGGTCAMEQGLADMVAHALNGREPDKSGDATVIRPVLRLQRGLATPRVIAAIARAFAPIGVRFSRVPEAVRRAAAAQAKYEAALARIGRTTLDYARANEIPAVVLCGSLHVIHDGAVNASLPAILRRNGVLPLPMDAFPIPAGISALPRAVWGDANRVLRVALAARARGDVYPVLLSSFGCGPASFNEHLFGHLMNGYPHTALETDGHGGAAGYVTRVQAFLHTVRKHNRRPSHVPCARIALLEPIRERPFEEERDARLIVFSVADRFSPIAAAAYRSIGFDAVASGPSSAATLALGRRDCSGKECLPYQLIWGAFRERLDERPNGKRTVLMQVQGTGPCRNCMFSAKDQITLERLGLSNRVTVRHVRPEPGFKLSFMTRVWAGAVAWDIVHQLACYHRAYGGDVDGLYARFAREIEAIVARPHTDGFRDIRGQRRDWRDLKDVVGNAGEAFAAIERRANGGLNRASLRTVLLSGDIYVRLDPFASDQLARHLAERGLRVLVEPLGVLAEYLVHERSPDLIGLPTDFLLNRVAWHLMGRIRRGLYGRARAQNSWLPEPDVVEMVRRARAVIGRHPVGEAPVTLGSVLHGWDARVCDGVVVANPWGCGPALVSESLLRHRRDIPTLFVYSDGSPTDERRLNAFAFRLRRDKLRTRS